MRGRLPNTETKNLLIKTVLEQQKLLIEKKDLQTREQTQHT